ncbi:MAG: hypothetical protein LBP89_00510 [Helicobacteraceae bacterium]|jgi:hypothetical protein|nr:hypothetical protein [Helicobacteraceae bacterium]
MEAKFVAIVERLVKEQGKDTLIDAKKCKAHLADYSNNEFKKERHLLLVAIEVGAGQAIATTDELDICKKQQIRLLKDDHFIDETAAAEAIDLLAFVLRGDRSKSIASTRNVQPRSALAYAPPPQSAASQLPNLPPYALASQPLQIDDDKLTGEYITAKELSIYDAEVTVNMLALIGALIGGGGGSRDDCRANWRIS